MIDNLLFIIVEYLRSEIIDFHKCAYLLEGSRPIMCGAVHRLNSNLIINIIRNIISLLHNIKLIFGKHLEMCTLRRPALD